MSRVWESRHQGPLVPYREGFRSELARLRFSLGGIQFQLWIVSQLNRWMVANGIGLAELTSDRVKQFLVVQRRRKSRKRVTTERALHPLFGYLQAQNVMLPPAKFAPKTPADELLERYRLYLIKQRDLASRTVANYDSVARQFLAYCLPVTGSVVALRGLTVANVAGFLLRKASRLPDQRAKNCMDWLRPFLRFLHLEGLTATQLAYALPSVARWRQSQLPARLTPSEVQTLLNSCDRSNAHGTRDFAILTLLARLGLRASEIASLNLGDLNWRTAEIVIRGKGRRCDRLPISTDVGEALVAYLCDGRPRTEIRHVFVTHCAPLRGIGSSVVRHAVHNACKRAGITALGPHRLRHTLASEMLRQGAALPEIAQVLRHRDLATTAIYAKVDREALRSVVQPWPGGGR